jgi:hypothetical protein
MAKLLAANSFYGKFGKTVGRTAREFIGVDFGYWNAARSAVVTMNGHRIGRIVDVEFEVVEPPRFPFPRRCVVVPLRGSGEEPKT